MGGGGPGGWKLRRGCEVSGSGCCVIFSCVSAAQIKKLFGVGVGGGEGVIAAHSGVAYEMITIRNCCQ